MISKKKRNKNLVVVIASIAATGGLLFGFDTGVISGAQNFLQDVNGWGISDSQLEWVTTAVLIGAVLGAALSGRVTDILGRKKVIIIAAIIFAFGAVATGAAPSVSMLVVGRIVIGVAIGIASFSVPLYISEISPTKNRGALVTMNQLMITIGILVSYISDYQSGSKPGFKYLTVTGRFRLPGNISLYFLNSFFYKFRIFYFVKNAPALFFSSFAYQPARSLRNKEHAYKQDDGREKTYIKHPAPGEWIRIIGNKVIAYV